MRLLRQAIHGNPALEEASDGKANKEIEHVFYGRIADMEELKNAKGVEHQEQWEIRVPKTDKNAVEGCIRIRRTAVPGQEPEYVMTTKARMGTAGDKLEVPIPTTQANFDQFKFISEQGMIKHRYLFPVPDSSLIWEIDVYLKDDGSYHEWAKIDLEVEDRQAPIPPMPIEFKDLITAATGSRSNEEEALVRSLYDTVFLTKNVHLAPTEPAKGPEHPAADVDPNAITEGTEGAVAEAAATAAVTGADAATDPAAADDGAAKPVEGADAAAATA